MLIRLIVGFMLFLHLSFSVASDDEPKKIPSPSWMKKCLSHVEDCTIYLVNPPVDLQQQNKLYFWRKLSARSYLDKKNLKEPFDGNVDVPLFGYIFDSFAGSYPDLAFYFGEVKMDAKAIAPYNAFRKVTGCWPFHIMDFVDLPADKEVDFLMSESGEVVDTDLETPFCVNQLSRAFDKEKPSSCVVHSRKGQFYVYGDSLYQLRFEVKGKMTEQEMASNTRFFVITGEGNNRTLEAVTAYNYTENVQLRTFPEGKCTKIESATPEWKAWDERSKEKIVYPPFPAALKEEYRKF